MRILPNTRQLLLHLAGSGGTGKSQVIQAIEYFTRIWKRSQLFVFTASSGAAATLIGGFTLHFALGIPVSLQPREPTESIRATWSEIGLGLKVRPEVLFGGLHIIFSGNFFSTAACWAYHLRTRYETEDNEQPQVLSYMARPATMIYMLNKRRRTLYQSPTSRSRMGGVVTTMANQSTYS